MPEAVSIILLCHNRWADTQRCLQSLRRFPPPCDHELLVYDNASTDGSSERLSALARGWPRLRVRRHERNLPFAAAMNLGMRAARGRWLLWLNNDTILTRGALAGLLRAARSGPEVGAVGPMTNHLAPAQQICRPFPCRPAGRAAEVSFLGGFCLLLERGAVRKAGPLDERFVWGWEDMDYCLRLRQVGRRLLLARDVFVRHAGSRTMATVDPEQRAWADRRNRSLLRRKWLRVQPWRADVLGLLERFPPAPLLKPGLPRQSPPKPQVSIVVLCRDPWRQIEPLLESVRLYTGKVSYEFVAAGLDAGSMTERRLAAIAGRWPQLRVLGPWRGLAPTRALNLLLREARGEHLCVLSRDALATPGWLNALLRAAQARPGVGIWGPRSAQAPLDWQRAEGPDPVRPVPYLRDDCLMIPRRVFELLGAFDERFTGALRGVDYCLRAGQAGFQVAVVPDACVRFNGVAEAPSPADSRLLFTKWAGHPLFGLGPRA